MPAGNNVSYVMAGKVVNLPACMYQDLWLASTPSRFDSEKLRSPPLRIHSTLCYKMTHLSINYEKKKYFLDLNNSYSFNICNCINWS